MGPLLRSGGTYAPAPAVVYGAPPVYSSLSLPATDPVLDSRSGSYAAADRQHAVVKEVGTAQDTAERRAPEYQTIDYYNPHTRIYEKKRYFKLEGNELLEWQPSAEKKEGVWVKATSVTRYYYADGQLYDERGNSLGRFGINNEAAKALKGKSFLDTWGTLETSRGFVDYSGSSLTLGRQAAIIQIGPPPGMVAAYRDSTKNIIVDYQGGTMFRQINNDRAYERIWVRPEDLTSGRVKDTRPKWTLDAIQKLPLSSDGYRYSPDGSVRFKSVTSGGFEPEMRIHHTTNWRDTTGSLCTARVGWVSEQSVITTPDTGRTVVRGRGIAPTDVPVKGAPVIDVPRDDGVPRGGPAPKKEVKKEEKKEDKKEGKVVGPTPPPSPPELLPPPRVTGRRDDPPPVVVKKEKDPPPVVVKKEKEPPVVVPTPTKDKKEEVVVRPPPPPVVVVPPQPPPLVLPAPVQRMAPQDQLVVFDMLQTVMLQKDFAMNLKGVTGAPLTTDEALLPGGSQGRFFGAPLVTQGGQLDRTAPSMTYDRRIREFIRPMLDDYADATRAPATTPLNATVLATLEKYQKEVIRSDGAVRDLTTKKDKRTGADISDDTLFNESADQVSISRRKLEGMLCDLARTYPGGPATFFKGLRDEADRRFGKDPISHGRFTAEIDLLESMVTGNPIPNFNQPGAALPMGVIPGPGFPGPGMPGPGMPGPGMPGPGMPGPGMQGPGMPGPGLPGPGMPGPGMQGPGIPGPGPNPMNGPLPPIEPSGWMPIPQRHRPGVLPDSPGDAIPNPNVPQPAPRRMQPRPDQLVS